MRFFLALLLSITTACGEVTSVCEDNPCENGGECTEAGAVVQCDCAPGFEGVRCAINSDDCDPNPCLNGGSCTDGVAEFTCACEAGFAGDQCEAEINECNPNPCSNGGTCTDELAGFTCACVTGFSDDTCGTCTATPVTKDFTALGTFVASTLDQIEVAITAQASGGAAANVNILNFNGIGVFGGTSDNSLDNTESLTFVFSRPVSDVTYFVGAAGNGDGNGTLGDASFQGFDANGTSLGTINTTSTGTKAVSTAFGNTPLSKFIVRSRLQDSHRINNMGFTTVCP